MKTRILGTLILIAVFAGILMPAFAVVRLEADVKSLMLEVQNALQKYHVAEELYPNRKLAGAGLISLLVDTGHLEAAPKNPWSGEDYSLPEDAQDFLEYETDELAETYTLIARKQDGKTVLLVLDSTENHSLE